MVVDTIKQLIFYFVNSKEPNEIAAETSTEAHTATATETMSTAIAANDDEDVQSLYSIVENGLKDNVSVEYNVCKNLSMYSLYTFCNGA